MKTLPPQMLRHTATIHIPEGVDAWRDITSAQSVTVTHVHAQISEGIKINSINADVQMHAQLWYDCKLSKPHGLDFIALYRAAERAGAGEKVRCTIGGATYRVEAVQLLPDGFGSPHHYELVMS